MINQDDAGSSITGIDNSLTFIVRHKLWRHVLCSTHNKPDDRYIKLRSRITHEYFILFLCLCLVWQLDSELGETIVYLAIFIALVYDLCQAHRYYNIYNISHHGANYSALAQQFKLNWRHPLISRRPLEFKLKLAEDNDTKDQVIKVFYKVSDTEEDYKFLRDVVLDGRSITYGDTFGWFYIKPSNNNTSENSFVHFPLRTDKAIRFSERIKSILQDTKQQC